MFRPIALLAALAIASPAYGAAERSPTPATEILLLKPIDVALMTPVAELTKKAEQGWAIGQFALSLLAADGLRGVAKDPARAAELRERALRAKIVTPGTQVYMPGVNGRPGMVQMVGGGSRPALSADEAGAVDRCVAALKTSAAGDADKGACGGPQVYDWLKARWAGQEVAGPASWRLLHLHCEDRLTVDAMWSIAAQKFEGGDLGQAKFVTDRIIAACGDGEPSWHPRVMRALAANLEKDYPKAAEVIAPVPKPGPAPIGSFSSFVAMQAYAGQKDWKAYAEARDALIAASAAALTDTAGPVKAREVERIALKDFEVTGYELVLEHGRFHRTAAFLVTPKDRKGEMVTFFLTRTASALDPKRFAWFLDEYRCSGHATVELFADRGPGEPPIGYQEARTVVVDRLEGRKSPVSSSTTNRPTACAAPQFVAPGLPG